MKCIDLNDTHVCKCIMLYVCRVMPSLHLLYKETFTRNIIKIVLTFPKSRGNGESEWNKLKCSLSLHIVV